MTPVRVLLVCLALLVVVRPAQAADHVRATLRAPSTTPVAGTPWRYVITAKNQRGTPLPAKARVQILRGTAVVRCWKGGAIVACKGASSGTWFSFTGKRAATLMWPARYVGDTLTFQATVLANGRSLRLRLPIRVQAP